MSIVLDAILRTAINPALAMLPATMDNDAARVMMLAAGLQESRLQYRCQKVPNDPYAKGPARGLWQFERGGVFAVMSNLVTKEHAIGLCKGLGEPLDASQVHARLEFNDRLAAGFARLLLWADGKALPNLDANHDDAWDCYRRCWRPGRPHRETWDEFHAQARSQVLA